MKTVHVEASRSYDILIEPGLLGEAGVRVREQTNASRVMLVSDDNVWPLYGPEVEASLQTQGISVCRYVIAHGESSKSIENYVNLLNVLAENHLTRSDCVAALGGGVVGDLAGFAASSYLRGVGFVQIPTTLLAMVDSSVGGKTAVDLPAGKNLAGAFYQPQLVLCDPRVLDTLPESVFSSGCAEVIKYAMLGNSAFFVELSRTPVKQQLEHVLEVCVTMKRDIVREDEYDRGARRTLNLGHTFGHAVEQCSAFQISHGAAVSIGMCMITQAAVRRGYCPQSAYEALRALLESHALPTQCPYRADELLAASMHDKKASGNSVSLIVPTGIGRCRILPVPFAELGGWLKDGGAL